MRNERHSMTATRRALANFVKKSPLPPSYIPKHSFVDASVSIGSSPSKTIYCSNKRIPAYLHRTIVGNKLLLKTTNVTSLQRANTSCQASHLRESPDIISMNKRRARYQCQIKSMAKKLDSSGLENVPNNSSGDESSFDDMNENEGQTEAGEAPINLVKDSLKMRSISNIHVTGVSPIMPLKSQPKSQPVERKRCVSYYENYRPSWQEDRKSPPPKVEPKVVNIKPKEKPKFYPGMDDFLPQYEPIILTSDSSTKSYSELKVHMESVTHRIKASPRKIAIGAYVQGVQKPPSATALINIDTQKKTHDDAATILGIIDEIGRYSLDLHKQYLTNGKKYDKVSQQLDKAYPQAACTVLL